ncbi:hypothetical protein N8Z24_00620 [bacterium]|nr:hypothetical protein [bacterium]
MSDPRKVGEVWDVRFKGSTNKNSMPRKFMGVGERVVDPVDDMPGKCEDEYFWDEKIDTRKVGELWEVSMSTGSSTRPRIFMGVGEKVVDTNGKAWDAEYNYKWIKKIRDINTNKMKKENKMQKMNKVVEDNKQAVVKATELTISSEILETVVSFLCEKFGPFEEYKDNPLMKLLAANIIHIMFSEFYPDKNVEKYTKAGLEASMLSCIQSLNVSDLVNKIKIIAGQGKVEE